MDQLVELARSHKDKCKVRLIYNALANNDKLSAIFYIQTMCDCFVWKCNITMLLPILISSIIYLPILLLTPFAFYKSRGDDWYLVNFITSGILSEEINKNSLQQLYNCL